MVPRDPLVHVPPHPLDRVAVRAVLRQEMQLDPIAMIPQVDNHFLAAVALRVVADDVDLAVPSQPDPQVVQVRQEHRYVPPPVSVGPR